MAKLAATVRRLKASGVTRLSRVHMPCASETSCSRPHRLLSRPGSSSPWEGEAAKGVGGGGNDPRVSKGSPVWWHPPHGPGLQNPCAFTQTLTHSEEPDTPGGEQWRSAVTSIPSSLPSCSRWHAVERTVRDYQLLAKPLGLTFSRDHMGDQTYLPLFHTSCLKRVNDCT